MIIPSYNRLPFLKRALDSVLNQSYKVDEILLIDDGSNDQSEVEIRRHYPQVRYFYQENLGVSAARNLGLKMCRGEWIALLDSDDEWQPHKIQRQIEALSQQPKMKICHCNETWLRKGKPLAQQEKHKKHGGHIFAHCLPLCVISPSAALIHHSVFDKVGLFDETLPACEDYDLWLRICAVYPVLFVDEALLIKHGGHDDQLSQKYWGMDRFRIFALDKILQQQDLKPEYRQLALEAITEKIRIYLLGAKKRQRNREVVEYEALLNEYCQAL